MNQTQLNQDNDFTILYVEDEDDIRDQVAHFLGKHYKNVLCATNGVDALELYSNMIIKPDLIISDIMMPEMDGLELTTSIRRVNPEQCIIFTTAFNDTSYLVSAIELGVSSYVLKPIDLSSLLSTIKKSQEQLRIKKLVISQQSQLEVYYDKTENDKTITIELMSKMMSPNICHPEHIKYSVTPSDFVGGDLVAIHQHSKNCTYFMLADATGHGLPAAINLLPINYIFYRMAKKGLPISLIVSELNNAVKSQSTTDRFVAALVGKIDGYNNLIEYWNGGIPAAQIFCDINKKSMELPSKFMPLGILSNDFDSQTTITPFSIGQQIICYSDGLTESFNQNGQMFGQQGLLDAISLSEPNNRFDSIVAAFKNHIGNISPIDDISLLTIAHPQS